MSKIDKLITRFLNKPKDLTWDELVAILNHYDYTEIATGKTGGSRRKFSNADKVIISLHKPHPRPIVKSYVIEQILTHLKRERKIEMIDSLKYQDYTAVIRYSSDDEVFFGKVTGINDLITFEGTSVTELKEAFQEAIEDYLKTCKTLGKSPDKTYKGIFNVRVPSGLHKKAVLFASQHQITLNDFVKTALVYAVKHENDISAELSNKEQIHNYALDA